MKKIFAVIGTRPQFIKHCPVALAAKGVFDLVSVDTGQHYDYNMSQVFLEELAIPLPDYNLDITSYLDSRQNNLGLKENLNGLMLSQNTQVRAMIRALMPVIKKESPSGVLVYGDTNSTIAGAWAAATLEIPVFHVEAGLRSFNSNMPEENNRMQTDRLSDLLFAPSSTAVENLRAEGIQKNVFMVGDVMLDMLQIAVQSGFSGKPGLPDEPFLFATIHRPYNTDDPQRLLDILKALESLPFRVRFSVHPRVKKFVNDLKGYSHPNIEFLAPLSYYDSINNILQCQAVITDSGGLQKEAYYLRKKCITIRPETEWTETLTGDWNTLVYDDLISIGKIISQPCGEYIHGLYGTGQAAPEIVRIIKEL